MSQIHAYVHETNFVIYKHFTAYDAYVSLSLSLRIKKTKFGFEPVSYYCKRYRIY